MPDVVLDTTVFIDAYNQQPAAVAILEHVARRRLDAGFSPVTVYELWLKPMDRDEESFYTSLLDIVEELPFTRNAARQVGIWLRATTRQQRSTLAADAMIAATAASLGATIITRNPRDFTRFYSDVQSY
ncbi:MAG: PIN domain-containing protein [Chloroflexota bacterium]